jgi:hypothetical protein
MSLKREMFVDIGIVLIKLIAAFEIVALLLSIVLLVEYVYG